MSGSSVQLIPCFNWRAGESLQTIFTTIYTCKTCSLYARNSFRVTQKPDGNTVCVNVLLYASKSNKPNWFA